MFSFLPLIDNLVAIGLHVLLLSISVIISLNKMFFVYLDCIIQYFYKYQIYYFSIQLKLLDC